MAIMHTHSATCCGAPHDMVSALPLRAGSRHVPVQPRHASTMLRAAPTDHVAAGPRPRQAGSASWQRRGPLGARRPRHENDAKGVWRHLLAAFARSLSRLHPQQGRFGFITRLADVNPCAGTHSALIEPAARRRGKGGGGAVRDV